MARKQYKDMTDREKAIHDMQLYDRRKNSLESMKYKIEALEYDKTSLRGMSDSEPVMGGDLNKQENKLVDIIDTQGDLEIKIKAVTNHIKSFEMGWKTLNDEQKMILDKYYVHPFKSKTARKERIASELSYNVRSIDRKIEDTVDYLSIALFGGLEE